MAADPPPARDNPRWVEEHSWITDKKELRALAHPVRWRILQELDVESPMTATRCAELMGESVASCSYHLNTLAKYGFVEPAPGGTGRERPWQMVAYDRSWRAGGEGLDDEAAIAAVALSEVSLEYLFEHMRAWLRWRSREEPRWVDATSFSESIAFVTSEELAELSAEMRALSMRYADRIHDPSLRPPGSRAARIVASTSMRRPPEADRE